LEVIWPQPEQKFASSGISAPQFEQNGINNISSEPATQGRLH